MSILIQSVLCSSVMEKLPATSYVRMVDIWLIFVQLMPFIEVLYLCTCPLCNKVDTTNRCEHSKYFRYFEMFHILYDISNILHEKDVTDLFKY